MFLHSIVHFFYTETGILNCLNVETFKFPYINISVGGKSMKFLRILKDAVEMSDFFYSTKLLRFQKDG